MTQREVLGLYGFIEDIYFFEVNNKYISSSVLKISMFSTHEIKYIWYFTKKSKFSFYFIGYFLEQYVNHASSRITIM